MTAKCIMIQGTGSSVGKSRLVTGFCRVFAQDGFKVAPFKAQNMALNSYITKDGLEMGRAQAVQAEACKIEPQAIMNPVLLKPRSDKNSQVVVKGKPIGSLSAMDYQDYKSKLKKIVKESYDELANSHDIVVIEGAGSPAEINLREDDIANMGVAELVDAPVVIAGDIDKGGVFASLAGTMLLLTDEERARVKGVIINKFRGDLRLLEPGLKMLEDIIKRPMLGVVPYADIYIDEEDSPQAEKERLLQKYIKTDSDASRHPIIVKILTLPRITNFNDFAPLAEYPGINLSYVSQGPIGDADMVLIPASENPKESIEFIRKREWDEEISELARKGAVIFAQGSSLPLLGRKFELPFDFETNESIEGLNLIDADIAMNPQQNIRVSGHISDNLTSPADVLNGEKINGYMIYSGNIRGEAVKKSFIKLDEAYSTVDGLDGFISSTGRVIGTFVHGLFDNPEFTKKFVSFLQICKYRRTFDFGDFESLNFKEFREKEFDRWADVLRNSVDIKKIYEIMGM